MKLQIANPTFQTDAPPGLMLSPDGRDWCSLDGGCAGGAVRPAAIVLTGSQRERVSPLLDLRWGRPLDLYATPAVFEHLTQALPLLPVLEQYCGVCWHLLAVAGEQQSVDFAIASWPQWSFTATQMPEHDARRAGAIALSVRDQASGRQVVFLPFLPLMPSTSRQDASAWNGADCIVVCEAEADDWPRIEAMAAPRKVVLERGAKNAHAQRNARRRGVELAHAGAALQV
jgi:pyrroloquinoline quinone biosynthesis protein B